jgi:hypothetical protein
MANVLVLTKPQPAQTSKPWRAWAVWVPSSKLPLVIWDNIQSASTEPNKTPMVYHMWKHIKKENMRFIFAYPPFLKKSNSVQEWKKQFSSVHWGGNWTIFAKILLNSGPELLKDASKMGPQVGNFSGFIYSLGDYLKPIIEPQKADL